MIDPDELHALCRRPLRLVPIPVGRVWGGTRLPTLHPDWPPPAPGSLPVGESWEVSDVGADPTLHSGIEGTCDANGSPITLRWLLEQAPREVLGAAIRGDSVTPPRLPLLFKFIDARAPLSVQLHPSDAVKPGEGKTEAWTILDADPGAFVIYGFEDDMDFDTYLDQARLGQGEVGLRRIPVQRGDLVYLPAGMVHAIGAGILLAEIQQSSDTTYRIYDWGRPRQLHLDEAEAVSVVAHPPPCPLPPPAGTDPDAPLRTRLDEGPFKIDEIQLRGGGVELPGRDDRFAILGVFEGAASLEGLSGSGSVSIPVQRGDVLFVPAAARLHPWRLAGSAWAHWMQPRPTPGR